jgi:uncharacterized integral membrane protein
VPDLKHLWQRFLLASSLLVGIIIGIAATVFGYDNRTSVDVHWSIFHINGVPLWTVAVVPLALFVIAGTLYHWVDGLHHFTEHMRHRRRVHELEAEVASLRAHLDRVLEMPDHSTSKLPAKTTTAASFAAADDGITDLGPAEAEPITAEPALPAQTPQLPAPSNVDGRGHIDQPSTKKPRSPNRKRAKLEVAGTHGPPDSGSHTDGMTENGTAAEPGDKLRREA